MKKIISLLLAVAVLAASVPLFGIVSLGAESGSAASKKTTGFAVGDTVKFGRFPQWRITNDWLKDTLRKRKDEFYCNRITLESGKSYGRKGDYFYFSAYIDWIIVGETDGCYLLLSKNILDWRAFGGGFWHQSDIRDWLNGEFYQLSFTEKEQTEIVTTENLTYYHPYADAYIDHKDPYDVATSDNVFLLDRDQAEALPLDIRITTGTEYSGKADVASRWYVRGPARWNYGSLQERFIEPDGETGAWYGTWSYGIRPAVKVNKDYIILSQSQLRNDDDWDEYDEVISERVSYVDKGDPKIKGSTVVSFSGDYLSGDSLNYNHALAKLCSQIVTIGYGREQDIKNLLKALKFKSESNCIIKLREGETSVNHIISYRDVTVDGKKYHVLLAAFIGSYHDQWYNNFRPGTGNIHQGFQDAQQYIREKINNYIGKDWTRDNTKIIITGHSRGAAIANLMAADFIKHNQIAYPENIYTYAFATPNSARKEYCRDKMYDRIFNFINPEDFVTYCIPSDWDYGKFGRILVLPSKSNESKNNYSSYLKNMQQSFQFLEEGMTYNPYPNGTAEVEEIVALVGRKVPTVADLHGDRHFAISLTDRSSLGEFFLNYLCRFLATKQMSVGISILRISRDCFADELFRKIAYFFLLGLENYKDDCISEIDSLGSYFKDAHTPQTYCAYLLSMSGGQAFNEGLKRASKHTRYYCISCPVDVEIYDLSSKKTVGRVVGDVVDETIAAQDNAIAISVNESSKCFSLPENGNYRVTITGNDSGTASISVRDMNYAEGESGRVNYYDLPVEKDAAYTLEQNNTEDQVLLTDAAGTLIEADQTLSANEAETLTVSVETEGYGSVDGAGTATIGDYIILKAETDKNNRFLGWYENGELKSKEPTYTFVARESVSLSAKFTDIIIPVSKLSVEDGLTVTVGLDDTELKALPISVKPENATHGQLVCSVGDGSVAEVVEVDGKEYVCGISAGTTQITVATTDGKQSVVIPVVVRGSVSPGDVDGDGAVKAEDARLALRASVKLEPDIVAGTAAYQAADYDNNGKVESSDARAILRVSVKLDPFA